MLRFCLLKSLAVLAALAPVVAVAQTPPASPALPKSYALTLESAELMIIGNAIDAQRREIDKLLEKLRGQVATQNVAATAPPEAAKEPPKP